MSQPGPVKLSLGHLKRLPRPAPPAGARAPLLLLLHGLGDNERNLFELAPQLDPRFVIVSLRAPLAWGPDSFAWFTVRFTEAGPQINPKELLASRDLVLKVIGEAAEAYSANREQVYLLGFSQGAIVSFATALTHPWALAGVVACGGRIPPEVEAWAVAPEEMAGLPVCVLHGTGDTVLPIEWARKARAFLEARGVALTYHEYDAPHTITPAMLADTNAWLADRLAAPIWRAGE